MSVREDEAVAAWLRRLTWSLGRMPQAERDDIVAETRAHLEERIAAGAPPAEALAAFGRPEDHARAFLDEMDVAVALGSSRPRDILRVILRFLNRSLFAFAAFIVLLLAGGFVVGLLIAAVWEVVDPVHVGLWTSPRGDFFIGQIDDPSSARDLLGIWLIPVTLGTAIAAAVMCRTLVIAAVRALARR